MNETETQMLIRNTKAALVGYEDEEYQAVKRLELARAAVARTKKKLDALLEREKEEEARRHEERMRHLKMIVPW